MFSDLPPIYVELATWRFSWTLGDVLAQLSAPK